MSLQRIPGRIAFSSILALAAAGPPVPLHADPFALPECDGVYGLAVVNYLRIEGPEVTTTSELSEICWNEATATLTTSHEASQGLELTSRQGGTALYQRLEGGTVSPENEQLEVGPWEGRPDGSMPYLRWTTESSRSREELNGNDFLTAEGFLLTAEGSTPPPAAATYGLDMKLTGVGGSIMSMVYNMFLPMHGALHIDGDALSVVLTEFMPGMGPGNVTLDLQLTETDFGYEGDAAMVMENALVAGAPDVMWKRIDLRLGEFYPQFSGTEVAFVASLVGEMESFGGGTAPVWFSLVGTGTQQ